PRYTDRMVNCLRPCPGCERHVRGSDTACPFCRVALQPLACDPPLGRGAGRAWAFGAVMLAGACSSHAIYGAPSGSGGGVDADGPSSPEHAAESGAFGHVALLGVRDAVAVGGLRFARFQLILQRRAEAAVAERVVRPQFDQLARGRLGVDEFSIVEELDGLL